MLVYFCLHSLIRLPVPSDAFLDLQCEYVVGRGGNTLPLGSNAKSVEISGLFSRIISVVFVCWFFLCLGPGDRRETFFISKS